MVSTISCQRKPEAQLRKREKRGILLDIREALP
jgi:hypothetical protein